MSDLISPALLAQLAELNQTAMPSRALIERPAEVRTPTGGTRLQWTTVASDVPCRLTSSLDPFAPRGEIADREAGKTGFKVAFPLGTSVRPGDRITAGGRVMIVGFIAASSFPTAVNVTASEIEGS